jgi:hypothetical protein
MPEQSSRVVTKRLVLVKEVRVKKIRREVRELQSVKLRREEVVVNRDNQIETKGDRNG